MHASASEPLDPVYHSAQTFVPDINMASSTDGPDRHRGLFIYGPLMFFTPLHHFVGLI